ncbi:MAG: porphobilinogen synthase [Phycisphaerae bacterium]|nr:porphobilinogen synthase [Phycisphaerae bacterium]
MGAYPTTRLRRLRYNKTLRDMLAGVSLRREELIAPLFVREGENDQRSIASMPGQDQYSVDLALPIVGRRRDKGLRAVLLFGVVEQKDDFGTRAWSADAPVQRLTAEIKAKYPDMLVITDTCLCEYTKHGHCGTVHPVGPDEMDVDNDETLVLLAKAAVSQAQAGADLVAPSAMMDYQVGAIRQALDQAGLHRTGIMSYSVKFASSLYGPFRDAGESPPQFGDRRSYQMDYRSPRQALAEARADVEEGADILMVKPALTYLDVIAELRRNFDLPLAAYHVSGEYSQIKAAAANGWVDEKAVVLETTTAIKRAGADLIITYFAETLAEWLE